MTTIHLRRSRKCEFMGIACVLMILHLIALLQTNAPKTQTHALAHGTSTSIQQKQKYKFRSPLEQSDVVFHRFGGDLAVIIFILAVNCNDQVNMISIWQTATNQTVIFSTDKYPNLSGGINSIAVNSVYVRRMNMQCFVSIPTVKMQPIYIWQLIEIMW